jgi:hypothetical protein
MGKKALLLLSICPWSDLMAAQDYYFGEESYTPFIASQSDQEAIQRLERQKMLAVQGRLKSESFINSIYLSALQELDGADYSLRTTNAYIKDMLQHLQGLEAKKVTLQEFKEYLSNLINKLGIFSPHPTLTHPLAFNLKEVPNYFTGNLDSAECSGFFAGTVQKADAQPLDQSWVFSLTIGDQNFEGKLNLREGLCPGLLCLTSKTLCNNKISFQVNPSLGDHWRDEKAIKAAWFKFLGLQSGDKPVVLYSPSQVIPKGIKVDDLPVIPTAVYYQPVIHYPEVVKTPDNFWSRLSQWIWGTPQPTPIVDGMFQIADGKYQTAGKIISDDVMKKPWDLTTYSGAKLTIHPNFDYHQSWDRPLILWNRYELKLATLFNFSQSSFDEAIKQSIQKFDAKPLCQDLETILLTYLGSDKEQEDVDLVLKSLAQFTHNLDGQLEILSTRKNELLKVIEDNRRKIIDAYQEGRYLLSKMKS